MSTKVRPASVAPSADGLGARRALEVHARGAQLLDDRAVAVDREERGDALGDDLPDAFDRRELLARRRGDRVEAAELRASGLRRGGPDVGDAEADEQPPSGCCFDSSIASTSSCADRSPMRSSGTSCSTVSE